jgi:hypothetical protein
VEHEGPSGETCKHGWCLQCASGGGHEDCYFKVELDEDLATRIRVHGRTDSRTFEKAAQIVLHCFTTGEEEEGRNVLTTWLSQAGFRHWFQSKAEDGQPACSKLNTLEVLASKLAGENAIFILESILKIKTVLLAPEGRSAKRPKTDYYGTLLEAVRDEEGGGLSEAEMVHAHQLWPWFKKIDGTKATHVSLV